MKKNIYTVSFILILFALAIIGLEWDQIWYFLKMKQRELNRVLMMIVRTLKGEFSATMFMKLVGISLVYGLLHALGPGHGKAIIAAHLINNNKRWKSALRTSLIGSATHIGVAVSIAFAFHFVFTGLGMFEKQNVGRYFSFGSGSLIILMGIAILFGALFKRFNVLDLSEKVKHDGMVGVLAGIVPCPVTMSIVLISLSYSILYVGIAAALGIALGLFIALCLVAAFPIYIMNGEKAFSKQSKIISVFKTATPVIQGLVFIIAGSLVLPL